MKAKSPVGTSGAAGSLHPKAESEEERALFDSWREMGTAVLQAIGCLHLLQRTMEYTMFEQTKDLAGDLPGDIYHLSEATSERLKAAFDSLRRRTSAARSK